MTDLNALSVAMRRFTEDRDWHRFHDPKSLMLALVGEVGELSELMQWLPADEVVERAQIQPLRGQVSAELADVLLYLIRLADVLGIDLAQAASLKLAEAEDRFPVEAVRSVAPVKGGDR